MSALPAPRTPTARLSQPSREVAPFVWAFITRDTRASHLAGADLLNRFPASLHCVLTWFLQGEADLLDDGGQPRQRLAGCVAAGCHTQPVTSRNRGDVHAFMVLFHPDAFHALFGIDLALLQNRFRPVDEVLPAQGLALVEAVFGAAAGAGRQ